MSSHTLAVFPGARLLHAGDLVEVVELDGTRVTVRNHRTGEFTAVRLGALVAHARSAEGPGHGDAGIAGVALAGLTARQRAEVSERAAHVREVITGYRAGHADAAAAGEPRPEFAAGQPMTLRYRAKAAELGVTARTVENWVAAYGSPVSWGWLIPGRCGVRAARSIPAGRMRCGGVLADGMDASTPTRSAVLARAARVLEDRHGPGAVPVPSRATAYRRLAELANGTKAVSGSAKGCAATTLRPTSPACSAPYCG